MPPKHKPKYYKPKDVQRFHDPNRIAQLVKELGRQKNAAPAVAPTVKLVKLGRQKNASATALVHMTVAAPAPAPAVAPTVPKRASPVKSPEIAKLAAAMPTPVRDSLPNFASPVRDSLPNMGSPDPKRKSTAAASASASLRRVATPLPLLMLTHSPEKYLGINPRRAVHTKRH